MYYEKFGENVSDLWLLAEFIHVNSTDLCESLPLFDSVSRQPLFLKKKFLVCYIANLEAIVVKNLFGFEISVWFESEAHKCFLKQVND